MAAGQGGPATGVDRGTGSAFGDGARDAGEFVSAAVEGAEAWGLRSLP
jgi:hypothetical protein